MLVISNNINNFTPNVTNGVDAIICDFKEYSPIKRQLQIGTTKSGINRWSGSLICRQAGLSPLVHQFPDISKEKISEKSCLMRFVKCVSSVEPQTSNDMVGFSKHKAPSITEGILVNRRLSKIHKIFQKNLAKSPNHGLRGVVPFFEETLNNL